MCAIVQERVPNWKSIIILCYALTALVVITIVFYRLDFYKLLPKITVLIWTFGQASAISGILC